MPHVELPQAEFKVVMLGETFTGKTSLVLRFAEGYYRDSSRNPTVGAFFITKRLTVQGMTAKIQIWDTAGQEQFKRLAPMYYKNAAAAIICYDVTSPKSFETLEYWMNELQQNIPAGGIVIAMCATKCDLENDPDTSQAEALAAQTGAMFVTTSSKTNSNVHLLFQKVTERVLDYQRRNNNALGILSSSAEIPVTLATTAVETGQQQQHQHQHQHNSTSPPSSPTRAMNYNGANNYNNNNNNNATIGDISPTSITSAQEHGGGALAGGGSPRHLFVDEKKMELDNNNNNYNNNNELVLNTEKKSSGDDDDDSTKHVNIMSRCDTNNLMCGDVVGVVSGEDGSMPGCVIQ